jgi:hypothetical protein
MSQIARRTHLAPDERELVGRRDVVLADLRTLALAGNRVEVVEQLPLPRGRLAVVARVIPAPPTPVTIRPRPYVAIAVGLGVGLGLAAGVTWLLSVLVEAIAANLLALAGIAALLLVVGSVAGGRVCETIVSVRHRH